MRDSLLRQLLRVVLLRVGRASHAVGAWAERAGTRPEPRPLPAWADAQRVDGAWARATRRSLAAGCAALAIAVFGAALVGAHVATPRSIEGQMARAVVDAVTPTTTATPSAATAKAPAASPAAAAAAKVAPATTPARRRAGAKPVALPTSVPGVRADLPVGKGMWIYEPMKAEGGEPATIVAKAKAVGLTHLYVRVGSSWDGFNGADFLGRLLPVAHAANIKVFGWDFPRLIDWQGDVNRALAAITYRSAGQSIDGFAADIETPSEGTYITTASADAYGTVLRKYVAQTYPLIAVVPRPSNHTAAVKYPYDKVIGHFDAVAPMVYWLNRQPDSDVAAAIHELAPFGKPVIPVGQAYDGAPEGGRPGVPTKDELDRFMATAAANGAPGVSFWSWQHADQQAWDAIRDAPQFRLAPKLYRHPG